ncbi:MAG: hypothetical protein R3C52_05915 [Hyphomonadaceae bacterium]
MSSSSPSDAESEPALAPGFDAATLKAANINPVTGLATDYLNHYNEAAMLVSMLADMPEMADEILAWAPIDYAEHFYRTAFKDRDLAVAAYDRADPDVKARFAAARREIETAIRGVQQVLSVSPSEPRDWGGEAQVIFDLIAQAGGVINGAEGEEAAGGPEEADGSPQSEIDALFA